MLIAEAAAKNTHLSSFNCSQAKAITLAFCKPCRVKTTTSWRQRTIKNIQHKRHATPYIRHICLRSTWETQSWVHQPTIWLTSEKISVSVAPSLDGDEEVAQHGASRLLGRKG